MVVKETTLLSTPLQERCAKTYWKVILFILLAFDYFYFIFLGVRRETCKDPLSLYSFDTEVATRLILKFRGI